MPLTLCNCSSAAVTLWSSTYFEHVDKVGSIVVNIYTCKNDLGLETTENEGFLTLKRTYE